MGAQEAPDMNPVEMLATTDSRPAHRVYVDGFLIDKTHVTKAAAYYFLPSVTAIKFIATLGSGV